MKVRLDIAVAVAEARAAGEPWKRLQGRFRLSRSLLAEAGRWGVRMLAAANDPRDEPGDRLSAAAGDPRVEPGDRSPGKMSSGHLGACIAGNSRQSVEAPEADAERSPMQALFPKTRLPTVTPAAAAPSAADPAVEDARKKAIILTQTERGRAATRLTSPLGATGTSNTLRTTLGGA